MPKAINPFDNDASLSQRLLSAHPAFEREVYSTLAPLSLGLAISFLGFVILGFIHSEAGENHIYIVGTDALSSAFFLACHILLRKGTLDQRLTHVVSLTIINLTLFNILLAFWFTANPFFLSYLPILVLGCGAILLSLWYAAFCYVVIIVCSMIVSSYLLPDITILQYSPVLLGSVVASGLILVLRRQYVITSERALLAMQAEIEERKRAEELLAHAQRLESTGKLVSGIAHDFNNLVMVMLGYTDSLLHENQGDSELRQDLISIQSAGKKAAALSAKLLAFSRHQVMQVEIVNVNQLIRDLSPLAERSIPDNIRVRLDLDENAADVSVDPLQMEQVILNLMLNARDAIGTDMGELTITTRGGVDGIVIQVSDTGGGIAENIRDEIFEPFYTTKAAGAGTGLGLSLAQGIVTQFGGSITVDSEVGVGTTFEIDLPLRQTTAAQPVTGGPEAEKSDSDLTILVVDDDNDVRKIVTRILETKSFRVLEAESAEAAIELAATSSFDLLLTDVVMPGKSGIELVETLRAQGFPQPALLMSGYVGDVTGQIPQIELPMIKKPFGAADLIQTIAEVMAAAKDRSGHKSP